MDALADGIWQVQGLSLPFVAGVRVPSASTVLRLASGELLVYSPIASMPDVEAHGTVAHVVEPNKYHRMFVGAARERWPHATFHTRELPLADDAVESLRVDGVPKFDELVLFHRPSKTLVVADFVFHMTAENLMSRIGFALTGVGGNRVAQSREWPWFRKDKAAARRSAERILAWPIERIAFCHGASVEIDSAGLAGLLRL